MTQHESYVPQRATSLPLTHWPDAPACNTACRQPTTDHLGNQHLPSPRKPVHRRGWHFRHLARGTLQHQSDLGRATRVCRITHADTAAQMLQGGKQGPPSHAIPRLADRQQAITSRDHLHVLSTRCWLITSTTAEHMRSWIWLARSQQLLGTFERMRDIYEVFNWFAISGVYVTCW
jgi:hypothetical protein